MVHSFAAARRPEWILTNLGERNYANDKTTPWVHVLLEFTGLASSIGNFPAPVFIVVLSYANNNRVELYSLLRGTNFLLRLSRNEFRIGSETSRSNSYFTALFPIPRKIVVRFSDTIVSYTSIALKRLESSSNSLPLSLALSHKKHSLVLPFSTINGWYDAFRNIRHMKLFTLRMNG